MSTNRTSLAVERLLKANESGKAAEAIMTKYQKMEDTLKNHFPGSAVAQEAVDFDPLADD